MLSVAGSDPSGGSGAQGDVMTLASLGCRGLTAVTAVTSQDTSGFAGAEPVSPKMLGAQLDSLLADFDVAAVKVGMLLTAAAARIVGRRIAEYGGPVVVDPVVRSTTGGVLLRRSALPEFRRSVVPAATVITPNEQELLAVSGRPGMWEGARALAGMGARCVVVTGVAGPGTVSDVVFEGGKSYRLGGPAMGDGRIRGSGCAHSAALAAYLGEGRGIGEAARAARRFARRAIRSASRAGAGIPVAGRGAPRPPEGGRRGLALLEAVRELARTDGIGRHIPECQTNFAFARPGAKSVKDVLGLDGRIVRCGPRREGAAVAGRVRYGGSRHVAAAVLEAGRRFPQIRSGANMRYDEDVVRVMEGAGMSVARYDRAAEPRRVREEEGASVPWGVREALAGLAAPCDAVCHAGAHGKEAMVVVFGRDPPDVLEKIRRVAAAAGRR